MNILWGRRFMISVLCVILAGSTIRVHAQSPFSTYQPGAELMDLAIQGNRPALPPGFQIVSTTNNSLVLDIQSPALKFEQIQNSAVRCEALKADGFSNNAAVGEPDVPSAGAMMGIPPGATPAIQILSMATTELPEKHHLCPVSRPIFRQDAGGMEVYDGEAYIENTSIFSVNGFYPQQPVEISLEGMIRSQRVARLHFTPVLYNPAKETLRTIQRVRVMIQFGNNGKGSPFIPDINEGSFEPLLQQTLINYSQARPWRSIPQPEGKSRAFPISLAQQEGGAYKIQVDKDGIYQLTYAALQSAGIPVGEGGLDPRTLQLHNQGVEIPIYLSNESDGVFNPEDTLLFYGQKQTTKYTDTNVYWLNWGGTNALRMDSLSSPITGGAASPVSYTTTQHLENDLLYRNNSPSGPNHDHWYWYFLNAYSAPASHDFPFTLQNLATGTFTARISGLLKSTNATPEHHTRIYLNGYLIEDLTWPSGVDLPFSITVPQTDLVEGANSIRVESPRDGGITVDQVLVNWFDVEYHRSYVAENNLLVFSNDDPGPQEYAVDGFSSSTIDVFDITNPIAPIRIVDGVTEPSGSLYRYRFEQQSTGLRQYLAISPKRWFTPLSITQDTPSTLRTPENGADYIIISHADFLTAIQPLADYRASQGMRVKVVDVQDVYDEFSGGVFNPQAIQSFLLYAYSNWTAPAPAYVLLVGDGFYDFKDYYGDNGPNFIPPFLGDFDPWIGEAASDNRYVAVSGSDILPDMYIGRLPANSAAETTAMVDKILAYEEQPLQADWNTHFTFVSDNADSGGDFPAFSNAIADHYLTPEKTVEKIYYGVTHTTPAEATAAILNAINQGRLIVNYTGHGSTQYWASERLLQVNNIANLNNAGKYPFFISMTCMEGYFIFPKIAPYNLPSVAESLMVASNKGAIASFSPTGFGEAAGHDVLAKGLYQALFTNGLTQFGPATSYAKYYLNINSTGFSDLLDTFILFGDPATRLKTSHPVSQLVSFTGSSFPGAIHLDWEMANEEGISGYNLLRADTIYGAQQTLNTDLILSDGQAQGAVYHYIDPVGTGKNYIYWLEVVFINDSFETYQISVDSLFGIRLPLIAH